MRVFKTSIAVILLVALGSLARADVAPPDQVVKAAAQKVLDTLRDQHDALKSDPGKVYELVEKDMLPVFDFNYTARLVLGRYWRTADDAQRKAFKDAFYRYLVHSYADGLVNYANDKVEVQPFRGDSSDKRAMIRTKVIRPDGPPVAVDYAMHRTADGWKAFDVTIEGVSYVTNYRNSFSGEIQQTSLDALIKRLNTESEKADNGKGAIGDQGGKTAANDKASSSNGG